MCVGLIFDRWTAKDYDIVSIKPAIPVAEVRLDLSWYGLL